MKIYGFCHPDKKGISGKKTGMNEDTGAAKKALFSTFWGWRPIKKVTKVEESAIFRWKSRQWLQ